MYAEEFLINAEDMNILRRQLTVQEEVKLSAKRTMAQREMELIRAAGGYAALGSNDKQRDFAKAELLQSDEAWTKAEDVAYRVGVSMMVIQTELDCYSNTRRAQEDVLKALEAGIPFREEEQEETKEGNG